MRTVRRRIRWLRLLLVLTVFTVLIGAIAGASVYTYKTIIPATVAVAKENNNRTDDGDRINILVMGLDDGDEEHAGAPRRSDAMILVSVLKEEKTVNLLSIPRDTRVEVPGKKGHEKIAHAYFYGGADLAVKTVEDFLQLPVHSYVVLDWQAFIKVIDLLGGVNLYVEKDMNYEDPYANLQIHLKKGYQHLDGYQAGQYIRFRSDELGDIGRVQRQQRFLKAVAVQALSAETIVKLPSLVSNINQYIITDITPLEAVKLGYLLKSVKTDNLQAEMLPGNFATVGGLSYWSADKEQTKQLVQRMFLPKYTKANGIFGSITRKN